MSARPVVKNPTAAVLIIGSEILSGRTADQNLNFLANRLFALNIQVEQAVVIPDRPAVIREQVQFLAPKFDHVFVTGGIGPTHDDVTTTAVAAALNLKVVLNPQARVWLEKHYGNAGALNSARLKMAEVPEGAALIVNPLTSAPGYKVQNIFVLAGVPSIMQAMFDQLVHHLKPGPPIHVLSLKTTVLEGQIAGPLANIQSDFPRVEIGSYPHLNFSGQTPYSLSLVFKGPDSVELNSAALQVQNVIKTLGHGFEVIVNDVKETGQ